MKKILMFSLIVTALSFAKLLTFTRVTQPILNLLSLSTVQFELPGKFVSNELICGEEDEGFAANPNRSRFGVRTWKELENGHGIAYDMLVYCSPFVFENESIKQNFVDLHLRESAFIDFYVFGSFSPDHSDSLVSEKYEGKNGVVVFSWLSRVFGRETTDCWGGYLVLNCRTPLYTVVAVVTDDTNFDFVEFLKSLILVYEDNFRSFRITGATFAQYAKDWLKSR